MGMLAWHPNINLKHFSQTLSWMKYPSYDNPFMAASTTFYEKTTAFGANRAFRALG